MWGLFKMPLVVFIFGWLLVSKVGRLVVSVNELSSEVREINKIKEVG
jgi:hypothetical protein